MTQERRFVPVYYDVPDDIRFTFVWPDDAALGLWLRLLMYADAAWPSLPALPANVRKAKLKLLTDAGIIEVLPDGRFRVHGLQAEREKRTTRARNAATARWHPEQTSLGLEDAAAMQVHSASNAEALQPQSTSNAQAMQPQSTSNADPMLRRRRDREIEEPIETSAYRPVPRERARAPGWDAAVTYLAQRGVYVAETSANGHVLALDRLLERHGWETLYPVFEQISPGGTNTLREFVLGAENILNKIAAPTKAQASGRVQSDSWRNPGNDNDAALAEYDRQEATKERRK